MLRVIVNSTPLMVLGNIGRLDILKEMYGNIVIPDAVYREISQKDDNASRAVLKAANDWIKVCSVADRKDYEMFSSRLHSGEVEVMILAGQAPEADLIILDDKAARRTAEYLKLPFTGTIGVLIKAKEKGIIPAVFPVIKELEGCGFYISEQVKNAIALKTGEVNYV